MNFADDLASGNPTRAHTEAGMLNLYSPACYIHTYTALKNEGRAQKPLLCSVTLYFSPEVVSIAENSKCTAELVQEFDSKLRWLMKHCGYRLEADDEEPSLLIRYLAKCCIVLTAHVLSNSVPPYMGG